MRALIDGDILTYECAVAGVYKDEETGEEIIKDFSKVIPVIDGKIADICKAVGSTEPPLIFLSGNEQLVSQINRATKFTGESIKWEPNFRYERAKLRPYKSQRKKEKPYHLNNIQLYLYGQYETNISIGCEADDELAIWQSKQTGPDKTIICSRDKDLKQVEGWHYGWEVNFQPEYGPIYVDGLGELIMTKKVIETEGKEVVKKKVSGNGLKFFYAQVLMGDPVDTIPGLPKCGPVKAYNLLSGTTTEEEMFIATRDAYIEVYGACKWKEQMQEQIDLVWMVRERVSGELVMHKMLEVKND